MTRRLTTTRTLAKNPDKPLYHKGGPHDNHRHTRKAGRFRRRFAQGGANAPTAEVVTSAQQQARCAPRHKWEEHAVNMSGIPFIYEPPEPVDWEAFDAALGDRIDREYDEWRDTQ
jgi:hypothetical protein